MLDFLALAEECAPQTNPQILERIVKTESSFNPYAIGVVEGRLQRQPKNEAEAIATVKELEKHGWNYSAGIAQVNKTNFKAYKLDTTNVFDSCTNLKAGAAIYEACYSRAILQTKDTSKAMEMALSCYYSGNFKTGFIPEAVDGKSYVQRVLEKETGTTSAIKVTARPVKKKKKKAAVIKGFKSRSGVTQQEISLTKEDEKKEGVTYF